MTIQKIFSAQAGIVSADLIEVESDVSVGLFSFSIIGLPDKAVDESKDRISSAIKHSGFKSPKSQNHKIVISLAPANLKKEGSSFDLPMALAYLSASKQIKFNSEKRIFIGELSLDGKAKKVRGVLPILISAKKLGFSEIFIPTENLTEASIFKEIKVWGYDNLKDLIFFLENKTGELKKPEEKTEFLERKNFDIFENIKGQEFAKRALIISAVGKHNLAFWGPPGSGKTLLARSYTEILPALEQEEIVEVNSIYSNLGLIKPILYPPFRSPHHSASYASMIGGKKIKEPGEITLAHHGTLFMDEFPEFDKRTLESLREPLESGEIRISRADRKEILPANFTLISAFNPCPCGFLGSEKNCICSSASIMNYRKKLSGPILDRIDLVIKVLPVKNQVLFESGKKDEMEKIRQQIFLARQKQKFRAKKFNLKQIFNAKLTVKELEMVCRISENQKKILDQATHKLNLSSRVTHKLIKIARTIADLENSENISDNNLLEAISYRSSL